MLESDALPCSGDGPPHELRVRETGARSVLRVMGTLQAVWCVRSSRMTMTECLCSCSEQGGQSDGGRRGLLKNASLLLRAHGTYRRRKWLPNSPVGAYAAPHQCPLHHRNGAGRPTRSSAALAAEYRPSREAWILLRPKSVCLRVVWLLC